MDIQLADILIHIDEALAIGQRSEIERQLRAIEGVISVPTRMIIYPFEVTLYSSPDS